MLGAALAVSAVLPELGRVLVGAVDEAGSETAKGENSSASSVSEPDLLPSPELDVSPMLEPPLPDALLVLYAPSCEGLLTRPGPAAVELGLRTEPLAPSQLSGRAEADGAGEPLTVGETLGLNSDAPTFSLGLPSGEGEAGRELDESEAASRPPGGTLPSELPATLCVYEGLGGRPRALLHGAAADPLAEASLVAPSKLLGRCHSLGEALGLPEPITPYACAEAESGVGLGQALLLPPLPMLPGNSLPRGLKVSPLMSPQPAPTMPGLGKGLPMGSPAATLVGVRGAAHEGGGVMAAPAAAAAVGVQGRDVCGCGVAALLKLRSEGGLRRGESVGAAADVGRGANVAPVGRTSSR